VSSDALERSFRDERAAVLATITRRLDGNLALAEDAVQDAFVAAAVEWDRRGAPDRPGAWLTTTAWRKALDRLRHERVAAAHAPDLAPPVSYDLETDFDRSSLEDDQLRMLFTCCHPAIAADARMALTLRSVAGLTVPEIARAFLSTESAMERRLTRARRKVTDARIPFRVPPDELLPERLAGVLRVVYLVFTEGHAATRGSDALRGDLCEEAIRLARLLLVLMPDEGEVRGLLGLMVLHHSRRDARVNAGGELVLLEDQDRSLWHADEIREGVALARAAAAGGAGRYALQALIASEHAGETTDWSRIAALYALLTEIERSPVVELNRAVAVAMADGPERGLELIDRLEGGLLERYHLLHSARADLLRRLDRAEEAAASYRRARELTENPAERAFLERRLRELSA
jgi:RNA polymerase sigma-70 factor, ECF subfamily